MQSEAQKRALKRYAEKTAQFIIRVNPETEPDIYEALKAAENRSGYIKALVRNDTEAKKANREGGED